MTRVRGDPRRQSTYQKPAKRTHQQTEQNEQSINQSIQPSPSISTTVVKSNRKSKKPKLSLEDDHIVETHFTDTIDAKQPTNQPINQSKRAAHVKQASEDAIAKAIKRKAANAAKPLKSALKSAPAVAQPINQPINQPAPKPVILPVPSLPALQPSAVCTFPPDARRSQLIDAIHHFYQHELASQLSVCETVYGVAAEQSQPHSYLTAFTQQVCDSFLARLPSILETIPLSINTTLPRCKHEQSSALEFWRDAVARADEKLAQFQQVQHSLNETFDNAQPPETIIESDVDNINANSLEEKTFDGYDQLSYQTGRILARLNYMTNQLEVGQLWRIETAKQARASVFGTGEHSTNQPINRQGVIKELVKQMAQPVSPMSKR